MKQKSINKLSHEFRFKRFSGKAYSAFNSMHKVVTIGVLSGCALSFAYSATTSAQTTVISVPEKITEKELDEITVTASRVETAINQTPRLVTVITREEIQRAPIQSIQDLLNYSANIDILQRGGHGVQADVSIRGGSSDQTAILLNGVNLSSPQTGHYSFDLPVNLSDIDHIEIIHGPSSLIYGASAFSGGINIVTRKNPDHKAYARIETGTHTLFGSEVRGVLSNTYTTNQLSFGYNRSDGYIANSDYDIINLLWQTRIKAESNSNIDIQLGYNDKKYGANTFYSAAYPNQYDEVGSYLASIRAETGRKLKFIPVVYWNRHNDCFQLVRGDKSQIPYNYHRTDVYGSNLNFQYESRLGISSLGVEFRNEGILSSVLGKKMDKPDGKYTNSDDRTNISYAFDHNFIIDRFILSAGILANYNTALKGDYRFYPAFNANYKIMDNVKVYASWNKAMRMPTFTDLYYNTKTHQGNTDLNYEESEALEVGFKYQNSFLQANFTGYYMEGKNFIDWVWYNENPSNSSGNGIWQSQNLAKIYKKGVEMDITLHFQKLIPSLNPASRLKLGYTHMIQDGRNSSGEISSNYILNYLRDKFTTQIDLPIYKDLYLNGHFRWQKRMGKYNKYMGSEAAVPTSYPAFSTLDLRLNWHYKNVLINISANNLYDTHYFDLGNIPQAGFWMSGGISYTIK